MQFSTREQRLVGYPIVLANERNAILDHIAETVD
jgi:hypothetical protein